MLRVWLLCVLFAQVSEEPLEERTQASFGGDIQKQCRQLDKFHALYSPLIENLVNARYILYHREKNEHLVKKFPEGQTQTLVAQKVAIYLAALPEDTKSPQLCVDKIIMREKTADDKIEFDDNSLEGSEKYIVVCYSLHLPLPSQVPRSSTTFLNIGLRKYTRQRN